jgi:hypothetical protein
MALTGSPLAIASRRALKSKSEAEGEVIKSRIVVNFTEHLQDKKI